MKARTAVSERARYYQARVNQHVSQFRQRLCAIEERNAWHLYGDIAWFGITNGILGTFTSVFAIRLGASETLIGLLSSLPALINIVWQVPSARIVERQRRLRPITVWSLFTSRVLYLVMALLPFFLVRYRAEAFVGLVILISLPGALGGVAFTSLLARSVPPAQRANVISIRNMLLSLLGMLSVLGAGRLLDTIVFPLNYQLLFAIAFVASLVSLYHVSRVQPLQEQTVLAPTGVQARRIPRLQLLQSWRALAAEPGFRNYLLGTFVYGWGLQFPMALYSLYRVRDLGASDTYLGLIATVHNIVQTVMYLPWGRLARRRGNRWVLLVNALGMAAFPFFTGLATRVEPLVLVSVLSGIFTAGHGFASFNVLLEVSPSDRLPRYTAIYNTVANVTAFIAPLLGTTVAGWIGTRYALMLAGLLRLLGALFMARLAFGDPPPAPAVGAWNASEHMLKYLAFLRPHRHHVGEAEERHEDTEDETAR